MSYYILQQGESVKKRYAVRAISRNNAHKKAIKLLGLGSWCYINKCETKEEVLNKFKCNIISERKV